MLDLQDIFGHGGPLARALPDFRVRREQLHMAQRVADALAMRESLVVEAGTGTGKTFAYLVPALLSGRRVLISTGTRTRPARAMLARVQRWARTTRRGDLAEIRGLSDAHPVWPQVTSTRESCLSTRCPEFARCHVVHARREALEADIVIVNHHLLLADLALKEDGFGDLLGSADAIILDEAHQIPDLATQFFGANVSSRQVETLVRDLRLELHAPAAGGAAAEPALRAVEAALQGLRAALPGIPGRSAWGAAAGSSAAAAQQLIEALEQLA